MLKPGLIAQNKGVTVESPNKPTEGSGPRVMPYPFLSVEYVGSYVEQVDKTTLADPRCCPNNGDHLTVRKALSFVCLASSLCLL